ARQRIVFDVDGAIGDARERFANYLGDARRPRGADDDLAAVLLLEAQRLLERVLIRLVHLEGAILLADPGLAVVETRLPLARRDLLDADGDLHAENLLKSSAA